MAFNGTRCAGHEDVILTVLYGFLAGPANEMLWKSFVWFSRLTNKWNTAKKMLKY